MWYDKGFYEFPTGFSKFNHEFIELTESLVLGCEKFRFILLHYKFLLY